MVRKTMEELNLLDDFLFQTVISRGEEGAEVCRILLNTILGMHLTRVRVVAQKVFTGAEYLQHGIRLDAYVEDISKENLFECDGEAEVTVLPDIYDIEPHCGYDKDSLPKRTRYYNALIDSKVLDAGDDYQKLRKVVIITILPYDPFGENRMMYTIKNMCVENPKVKYEDGCKKIFLYTKGQTSSQTLKEMIEYMADSNVEHVTNQDIETIHRTVSKVRRDKEVSIGYMKSWEIEAMRREEGREEGREEVMGTLIESLQEVGISKEDIIVKLKRKFLLSDEQVERNMERYYKV